MTSAIAAIDPGMSVAQTMQTQLAQAGDGAGQSAATGNNAGGNVTASLRADSSVSVSALSVSMPDRVNGADMRAVADTLFTDLKQSDLEARPQSLPDTLNSSKIDSAREDLLPSPWKAEGSSFVPDKTAVENKVNPHDTLRKSFDHAVFITLVTQVVGGVSQTTNNLLRQP